MLRIDTTGRHAQMIECHAGRDGTDELLERVSMRKHLSPDGSALDVEVAVAVGTHRSGPDPTARPSGELGLEPLKFRLRCGSHPTKYTEYIGRALLAIVEARSAA